MTPFQSAIGSKNVPRRVNRRGRVPVVLQMNMVECGAACLAMILGYFGRKTRLEECRQKCEAGRDGVTARTVAAAAREFGLRTRALSLPAGQLRHIAVPAVLHWNSNHFVVLEGWASRDSARIVDPAFGRRTVSLNELEASFSGVALVFEPDAGFEQKPPREPNQALVWARRILNVPDTRALLARIFAASALLQLLGFIFPAVTRLVVDAIIPARAFAELDLLGVGALVIALTHASVSYCRSTLLIRLEKRLDSTLMLGFFRHLLSLPYRFFQERSSGDLLMRLGSNVVIRDVLASYTTSALLDGSLLVVYLAVLIHVAPLFGVAALCMALLEAAILLGASGRLHVLLEADLARQSESQSCLMESLIGIGTLKAAGMEDRALGRWSNLLAKQLDASFERSRFSAKIDAATSVIRIFSPLCLLWLGGREVLNGSMTLGTMLGVNALATVFLIPVSSLVSSAQRIQLAGAHLERISDVMRAHAEQDPESVRPAPRLTGALDLRHVSYRYQSDGPLVLHDITLAIRPGQKVALVGRSGSGKSTLAKLLLGLYAPSEGQVLYDGEPLNQLNLRTVRKQWGAVLQDAFLFSSSVQDNIAFHDDAVPLTEIRAAAQIAGIHDAIQAMPMAYLTRVDEGGSSLSGGQRQRLAIARAVVNRPALLVLDEATSQLDVLTEAVVDRNLDRLSCTRVVVAHRLSTVRNADLIVVLDRGSIVEMGTHDELLAANSHYAGLVRRQLDGEPV
ncbi:MAG TPA: peptidase domain-containing ABC transporter [Bryobacteraceae bacterium]|nr:peptidase domain-containing ABC transporter [Bryobacteraceae bacterium]